ncbi:Lysine histidine transporter 1 [Ananas comosus]|uniref:Lysine histidine transporter 1 n=1 Tax=Ananas comosus TaxID=4615 RepID=A0A199UM29_ANACO|nr:Lysine histidine transporter 1 [Ananas comosus]
MVGAGVLSLPYAMAHLGWGPGTLALVVSWCITLYTLWLMIELHECVPGKRFDRYRDLGEHAFGPRLGPWIVVPQQLIVQVGCDTVYMVTGGKCLQKFAEIACPACAPLRQSYWICIFGSFQFVLSQLPNLNSVAAVSFAAAAMSLSYSTISWVACFARGRPARGVSYGYKKSATAWDSVFRVFSALGQVAFAYAGHGVVLEIQATIPSTPAEPSKATMWRGTVAAYFVTALCYFPVAMIGYWAFGQDVDDNVYAMPVFDSIETLLITRLKLRPGITLRLIARSAYVAFTLFVGVTFPFFADLLGFFGGFGFTPTSYFLPCIIWLAIKKPRRFSLSWVANWGCIVIGVLIMFASTIGGLRNIIADASTFQFYS